MSKSPKRRASQSRLPLGKSADLIQSPCSRQRMRILVSARLQATAAPEAPEPMIRTSTLSLPAISGRPVIAPERRALLDDLDQRPVALLQRVALRKRRPCLVPDGLEHAIVAIVGGEDRPPERHRGRTAGGVPSVDQRLALGAIETGEVARRLGLDRRQSLAHQ